MIFRRSNLALPLALLFVLLSGCEEGNQKDDGPFPPKPGEGSPAKEEKSGNSGIHGWLNWRGPQQTGVSTETGLPAELKADAALWTYPLKGRGSPVVANGRLFVFGYTGEGPDLREVIACFDAENGKLHWEHRFTDFLSDIIYDRYAIGAPTVDRETGNVYAVTSPGLLLCFSPDGKKLWERSLMEEFGRMTFPNGRTGTTVIDQDLLILHYIMSNWGAQGPAQDRFYAFDKKTGEPVWHGSTGQRPKDNSFSTPFFDWKDGKRVFYAGTGDGSLACFNARSGDCLWRFKLSMGGVNASLVMHPSGKLVGIHNLENIDSSEIGRMVAIDVNAKPEEAEGAPQLPKSAEVWRNELGAFSSSPVLVGDTVYQMSEGGELNAVDIHTGKIKWHLKLGIETLHGSPIFADGKLYAGVLAGDFYVIRPGEAKGEILSKVKLEGNCIGTPLAWNGKLYVHTTAKLYCFGKKGDNPGRPKPTASKPHPQGTSRKELQIIPNEVLLRPGGKAVLRMRAIDEHGFTVGEETQAAWEKWIPPTAKVKVKMNADVNTANELVATEDKVPSAGAYKATANGISGTMRGRVLPYLPLHEDFNGFEISVPHAEETGVTFAYPPLPWIGARFKWEVREVNGEKCLAKTIDHKLFQRAITFIGHPEMKNYTIQVDVMSDGNRRKMSEVGVIHQRYMIVLKGNAQQLEVNSNLERLRESVAFKWTPGKWYTLKTRVDVGGGGAGHVRAKVWPKGEAEPAAWTLEVPVQDAHTHGSPGLFGFSPQEMRVYVDNLSVTPNAK